MPDQSKRDRTEETKIWSEFQKRNSGHRFLTGDPIYSLPKELIKKINTEIPGFLSKSDLKFENDLSEMTQDGFFLGKRLEFFPDMDPNNISPDLKKTISEINKVKEEQKKQKIDSNVEILKITQPSRNPELIKKAILKREKFDSGFDVERHKKITRRMKSYIGWLCVNVYYLFELKVLKNLCLKTINLHGGFHRFDLDLRFQKLFNNNEYTDAKRYLDDFYCNWNINTFHTWDIPELSNPIFSNGSFGEIPKHQNGIYVFLPFYCVKGKLFDLDKEISKAEKNENLGHFISFFEMEEKKGYSYYENMYNFFRFFYLPIYSRYKGKLKGNMEKFDGILECLWNGDPDSVAKIRKDFFRFYKTYVILSDGK